MNIDDLLREMREAVEEAYAQGYQAGADAATASILKAAQAVSGPSIPAGVAHRRVTSVQPDMVSEDDVKRLLVQIKHKAPRGLTRKVVRNVLAHGLGLPMGEIQQRAMEADSRLSAKTIYNELYRGKGYYRDTAGRWRLLTPEESANRHAEQLGLTDAPLEREEMEAPIVH